LTHGRAGPAVPFTPKVRATAVRRSTPCAPPADRSPPRATHA